MSSKTLGWERWPYILQVSVYTNTVGRGGLNILQVSVYTNTVGRGGLNILQVSVYTNTKHKVGLSVNHQLTLAYVSTESSSGQSLRM